MQAAKFTVDYEDLKALEERLKDIPGKAEKAINEVLHGEGAELAVKAVTNLLPVSDRRKKHAKESNWSKTLTENLGFTIMTRGGAAKNKNSYGYLTFPDKGIGRSNPIAQNFTGRAEEDYTPQLLKLMHNKITSTLQEVF